MNIKGSRTILKRMLSLLLTAALLMPAMATCWGNAEEITYLFKPDLKAEPYVSNPVIIAEGATPGTEGVDGWIYDAASTSNFASGNYFRVTDHSAVPGAKMYEMNINNANRLVYHPFSEAVYSGVFTMSFDFEFNVLTAGSGFYNIRLVNTAGTAAAATSIRFYTDGTLRIGGATVNLTENLQNNHWYRLTAVYDIGTKKVTYYLHDNKTAFLDAVANGTGVSQTFALSSGLGFQGVIFAGCASPTQAILNFSNLRVFLGNCTEETDMPPFVYDSPGGEDPEDPQEPEIPEEPEQPGEFQYLFYPKFNAEPYLSSPVIIPSGAVPGTAGVDGWVYHPNSTANFSSSNYFGIVDHTVNTGSKMLSLNLTSSNRSVYHPFTTPISSGVYTMSFDFFIRIDTPGAGFYNIRLVNSENVFASTTSIRIYGDGKVTYGINNEVLLPTLQQNHWYRVTVVYDLDHAIGTYYLHDNEEDYLEAVQNGTGLTANINLPAGLSFTGVAVSGMGSSTAGTIYFDNWRVFTGTTEPETPPFIDNSEVPEEPEEPEEPEQPGDYLFYPNFNAEPYLSSPNVITSGAAPGYTGIDGWVYDKSSTSNFSSSNYVRVTDHSTMGQRKMLEMYISTSNRLIYHPFSQTQYNGTFTMSFDFEVNIQNEGTGFYNFRLLNTQGTAASTTSIRFYGDGSVRIGGSTVILEPNLYSNHWYRLTVVYNLDAKTATYYLHDNREDYLADVAAGRGVTQGINVPAGVGFQGILIAGAGSETEMTMHFDNWRVFTGKIEREEPDFVVDPRPVPTRYLFNETFPSATYRFGEHLFKPGDPNGTVKNWTKAGNAPNTKEYFQITEHTKIENNLVGAIYLTSGSNSIDRALPEAIIPAPGVKLTFSFDFMLKPDQDADPALFYRIALMNGATRRDTTDLRIYANGNISFNNNKFAIPEPLKNQSDWHRLTVVYNLETLTADYYLDNVFQGTGGKFTMDATGVTAVRISGPGGAMGVLMMDNIRAYLGDMQEETYPPAMVDNSRTVYQPNGDSKPYAETTLAASTDYPFDYTFVWTTDPQNLVKFRPDLHLRNMQWLVDNKEALNIQYIMNTGDLVTDSSSLQQWMDADAAQRLLDEAGIPNGVLAGNHDTNSGTYTRYYEFFGEDRYKHNEWYGGSYKNNFGHYDLITVGDTDFIMIYMSYLYDGNPQEIAAQIDWMNEVLAQYPRHNAILLFHDYLEVRATEGRSAFGQQIFEEVVYPNQNVFMVLTGHVLGTWRQETNINGRIVHEIVYNYQGTETANGDGKASRYNRYMWGMIRLLQMDETNNKIHFRTFSPINDSITIYDTVDSPPASYERDHFSIDFHFGRADNTVTVEQAPTASTITYGQPLSASRLRDGRLVNSIGNMVGGTLTWQDGQQVLNAGTHTVKAVFTPSDAYYEPMTIDVTVRVLPREIIVIPAAGQSKIVGEADPVFTYTYSGLLGQDTLSGALGREAGEQPGWYDFTPGTLTAGDNYTIVVIQGSGFRIVDNTVYADILGTVKDGETPLKDVLVSLIRADEPADSLEAYTDENGAYAFSHLPAGAYTLTFTADGYQTLTEQVTITEGDVVKDVSLEKVITPPEREKGDVSGNGTVDISDARLILQAAVGKITLSEEQAAAADVNGDGKVTSSDARLVLSYVVGKLDSFPS